MRVVDGLDNMPIWFRTAQSITGASVLVNPMEVRLWGTLVFRHLPACPAVLNDFAWDLECTDLAFQSSYRGIAGVVSVVVANLLVLPRMFCFER